MQVHESLPAKRKAMFQSIDVHKRIFGTLHIASQKPAPDSKPKPPVDTGKKRDDSKNNL